MTSNVYLAFGTKDGHRFMKVGKANNVANRQRQIGIHIEVSIPCDSESGAFELESRLRRMMCNSGATRISNTHDWFVFDGRIYDDIRQFLSNDVTVASLLEYKNGMTAEDYEVAWFREYYNVHRQLEDAGISFVDTSERDAALARVAELEQMQRELRNRLAALQDAWQLDTERHLREHALNERPDVPVVEALREKLIRAEFELELWRSGRLKPE